MLGSNSRHKPTHFAFWKQTLAKELSPRGTEINRDVITDPRACCRETCSSGASVQMYIVDCALVREIDPESRHGLAYVDPILMTNPANNGGGISFLAGQAGSD